MKCPKCKSRMESIDYHSVAIDRCSFCKGLWFDFGDIKMLKNKAAAAAIDIGDPRRGEHTNAIDHYPCPRCSGSMVRMVDARQPHIWYEECGSCSGAFFDAGELTDLSEFTLSDFFKRFSTPERT